MRRLAWPWDPRRGCPPGWVLGRATSQGMTGELSAHLADCDHCAGDLHALEQLSQRAQELKTTSIPGASRERIVMALRSETAALRQRPTIVARTSLKLGAAAAVAVLGTGTLLASLYHRPPEVPTTPAHASVRVIGSASYTRTLNAGDEIIRLESGMVEIEARPMAANERLRVVTGDAEVEVRGTRFDVTAAGDRLQAVRVFHGTVEVRTGGTRIARLGEGDQWAVARQGATTASDPIQGLEGATLLVHAEGAGLAGAPPDQPQPRAVPAAADHPTGHAHQRTTALRHGATAPPAPAGAPVALPAAQHAAFEQGWQLLRSGRLMEAATAFAALERNAPGDPIVEDAMFWRGVALSRAGQKLEGRTVMSAFVSRFPLSPRAGEASTMLGWMMVEAGDRAGAVALFERAARDRSARVRASARNGLQQIEALDVPVPPSPPAAPPFTR